jgi:hypothetical protein
MFADSQGNQGGYPARIHAERGRGIVLRLLLALCLGALNQPPTARAAPAVDTLYILPKLEASPQGSTDLCPGENLWIYVTYSETRYRVASEVGAPVEGAPESGVEIEGFGYDTAVGRLLNPSLETRTHRGLVVAPFVFKANKPGDTSITFETSSNNLAPLSPQNEVRLPTSPATVNIHVGCKFTIREFGVWSLPGERIIDVFGSLYATGEPDQTQHFQSPAPMSYFGVWTGPCAGVSTISSAPHTVNGYAHDDQIELSIDYSPISGSATEGCEGKSAPGTASLDRLEVRMPIDGGTISQEHCGDSYVRVCDAATIVVTKTRN